MVRSRRPTNRGERGSVCGGVSAKFGPRTFMDRRSSSCIAGGTKKQPGRPILRPSLGAKQIATKQSRFCNLSLRPLFRTLLLVLFLSWQRGGLNRRIQGRPAGRCSGGLSGLPRLRGKVVGVLTPTHPSPNRCIETLHCCRGPGFMPTGRVCGATAGCEATPAGGGVWPPSRATNAQYRTARKSGGPGGGSS